MIIAQDRIYYYIHTHESGKYIVGRMRFYHGDENKRYLTHAAWIDPPGTYWEQEWNLHYDGCDYSFPDLIRCLQKLIEYDGYVMENSRYVRRPCFFTLTGEKFIEPRYPNPHKQYQNYRW